MFGFRRKINVDFEIWSLAGQMCIGLGGHGVGWCLGFMSLFDGSRGQSAGLLKGASEAITFEVDWNSWSC